MVSLFSADTYAVQPLHPDDGMVQKSATAARQGRTTTDNAGLDASTCVYNRTTWENRSFVSDMWLSPILMFRTARIYDRGDGDYDSVSEDGTLRFTLVAQRDWGDAFLHAEENFRENTTKIQSLNLVPDFWSLDGKPYTFPTWKTY